MGINFISFILLMYLGLPLQILNTAKAVQITEDRPSIKASLGAATIDLQTKKPSQTVSAIKNKTSLKSKPSHIGKGTFLSQLKTPENSDLKGFGSKAFPIIYNSQTQSWIYHFIQSKNINYIKLWLKRSYRYFPLMQSTLRKQNLPKELAYMTLIESGLSARAVSSANAVGYWQFIKPTAKRYGLRVNHWIDERRDFEKSTLAASRYLSFLYKEFDDWLLAMAAYNMGEDRLHQLIAKYNSKDFWILAKKHDFPKESSLYVPKILAAAIIMKYPERYGFNKFNILTPYQYDIFYIPGGTDLKKLCQETSLSYSQFKTLNPELKTSLIPIYIPHHRIRVPEGKGWKISNWLKKNQASL